MKAKIIACMLGLTAILGGCAVNVPDISSVASSEYSGPVTTPLIDLKENNSAPAMASSEASSIEETEAVSAASSEDTQEDVALQDMTFSFEGVSKDLDETQKKDFVAAYDEVCDGDTLLVSGDTIMGMSADNTIIYLNIRDQDGKNLYKTYSTPDDYYLAWYDTAADGTEQLSAMHAVNKKDTDIKFSTSVLAEETLEYVGVAEFKGNTYDVIKGALKDNELSRDQYLFFNDGKFEAYADNLDGVNTAKDLVFVSIWNDTSKPAVFDNVNIEEVSYEELMDQLLTLSFGA